MHRGSECVFLGILAVGCASPSGGNSAMGGVGGAAAATGGARAVSSGGATASGGSTSGGSAGASAAGAATSGGSGGSIATGGAAGNTGGSGGSARGGSAGANAATGGNGGSPSVCGKALSPANPWPGPDLTAGVWKAITPPGLDVGTATFGTAHVEIDPSDPLTLYAAADQRGLWKTTNAGRTWAVLGDPNATYDYGTTAKYLDSPILVRIDPCDRLHLYATQGVRGKTLGFWVTTDGGQNWTMPAGFVSVASSIGTRDMTQMSVDPTDFRHAIVGSHSAWSGSTPAGVLETKDGGATFVAHPAMPTWGSGSIGLHFLYEPELGIGNANTWLVATDGNGFWRTTDGAASWKQVETWGCPHGGNSIYYASNGALYAGGYQYPVRSTDNGATWSQISSGLGYAYYYTVQGDGNTLYTMKSFADNGAKYGVPYSVSPESDGRTWTAYQGGAQKFDNGPFTMHFDKVNRIMYSANWNAGIWALKVLNP